ncbi:MAG: hypothetical protein OEW67_06680 [Cyclobacteriaceae bacterium]|nr:hypothetical protein [Cyclobacteriaceae bacterium]
MKTYYLFLLLLIIGISCSTKNEKELSAQQIIDKAIEAAGGTLFEKAEIDFDFRGRHYRSIRNGGNYQHERIFNDSLDVIRDVLNNEGFERYINDSISTLTPDSMKVKYANSVNSVLYFALLPYGLNDPAVIKKHLGESSINNKKYFKIQISFHQEGGGKDYEDVFVYWIEQQYFTVDYFAYSYVTDGGGARFRSAYNTRIVNGIRFSDYINYKPMSKHYSVDILDEAFQKNDLKELSRIEAENIKVNINP